MARADIVWVLKYRGSNPEVYYGGDRAPVNKLRSAVMFHTKASALATLKHLVNGGQLNSGSWSAVERSTE